MAADQKIWYSFRGGKPDKEHCNFYPELKYKWVAELEKKFDVIQEEIEQYLNAHESNIIPYFNKELVSNNNNWKSFALFTWGIDRKKNCAQCPNSYEILKKIPGIVSASISIMEANTHILPHIGDTNAIMRAHLGLKIPDSLPYCGIRVGGEKRSWKEKKVLIFNDSIIHEAWNHTNYQRQVMIIDIVMPEFINRKYQICSKVISGLIIQSAFQKFAFLKHIPRIIPGIVLYTISFVLFIRFKIINKLS